MHDVLIKNSPKLDRDSLIKYAKDIGLDVKVFTESLDSRKHAARIEKDKKLAVDLDLYNTPRFLSTADGYRRTAL
jgi:predicted DsbA family dithiol-disulfide isomerase